METTIGLNEQLTRDSETAARLVAGVFGPATRSIIHYGSRVHGAGVRSSSEYDFVVVVENYDAAIRSILTNTEQRFSEFTGSLLTRWLPPTILAVPLPGARPRRAKCVVYSTDDFDRACSDYALDHFLRGRLCQHVIVAWCKDMPALKRAEQGIAQCRRATIDWVEPRLPESFDEALFFQTLLRVSYSAEIRPEQRSRAREVYEAQKESMLPLYRALLFTQTESGRLLQMGNRFQYAVRPTAHTSESWARYFRRSKVRATARWLKSAWVYRGWLDYLQQKMQRRVLSPAIKES